MTQGVSEVRRRQFDLWFFRDLTADQRSKLYQLAGLPSEEIRTHSHEHIALDHIMSGLRVSPPPDGEVAVKVKGLRDKGWMVAVHNDYRQNGVFHTFWLFTHPDGRWIKGEGPTDEAAVNQAASATAGKGETR